MTTFRIFREGDLELLIPENTTCIKFENNHGLSYCMKSVDFILITRERIIFVELKDPDHPNVRQQNREKFLKKLKSKQLIHELVRKYRDSFLYQWAERDLELPAFYYVLIALKTLDNAMLLTQTDELKRNLPVNGPERWQRQIVNGCAVFNLRTWNQHLQHYPVRRVSNTNNEQ